MQPIIHARCWTGFVLDQGEDGVKPIWIFDHQITANPISIATCPAPRDRDYKAVGGHFEPHCIHENRPCTFVSKVLHIATCQNAGVRVNDIRDALHSTEVGV